MILLCVKWFFIGLIVAATAATLAVLIVAATDDHILGW